MVNLILAIMIATLIVLVINSNGSWTGNSFRNYFNGK